MFELIAAAALATADPALEAACRPLRAGAAVDLIGERNAREQARDPGEPVAVVADRQSMVLLPDGRFLLRTSTVYPGDIEFRFRTLADAKGEDTVDELGWREGDKLQHDDAASSAKDNADLRLRIPGLAACDALAGQAERVGDEFRYADIAGQPTVLVVDGEGALTEGRAGNIRYRYEGWRAGGSGPATVMQEAGGRLVARWIARARPVRPEDMALLKLPAGYAPADPAGALRATMLSDGVYRIDGAPSGYHTGFVVGARGVVLFDAPVAVEEAKAVRAVIEQAAPGRPISHVVVSHVHRDHVGGLPAYGEAQVLTGAGGEAALRRQFGAAAPAKIREVVAKERLDLGGRSVRVMPLASSSHAATMLVGFDETSGALFQGDLFYLPERGATPPAFVVSRELRDLITAEGLKVGPIVGVHGRTGELADLDRSLALVKPWPGDQRGCIGIQLTMPAFCIAR